MVKATAANVAADMSPPNYRGAVKVLGGIDAKKKAIAAKNGEIAGIYDRIEGYKVNKKAAKIFMALTGLEVPERNDILRSLEGLIAAAEWDRSDLLDRDNGDPNDDGGEESDDDGEEGGEEPEADEIEELSSEVSGEEPPVVDDVEGAAAAVEEPAGEPEGESKSAQMLRRSRRHLRAVGDTEPYTGDNSDLNPNSAAAG